MKHSYILRIRIISVAIFLFALLLIGRLYILQIVKNDTYTNKADRQYSSGANKVFSRGSIYFQNKDGTMVSAATLKSGFIIAVNPKILENPEDVWNKIKDFVEIDHDTFISKATKKNDPYEEIATHVDETIGKKISDLNIKGLQVYRERWRFYPGGNTASHILGILGYKGDEYAGRYGIESEYNALLERKDGAYVNFFAEMFSDIKSATNPDKDTEGDIVTTIEPTVQTFLQSVLATTTEKWSSDLTGGIIMDPKTGEIVAMETFPTFDPNKPEQEKSAHIFSNPLVENVYEMGSIIKPLTVAAGIDTGVITSKTTYYDKGYVIISGKKVSNFDGKERGVVSMQDLLSYSLNVGAARVQSLIGNKRFAEYMMSSYGFGEKTGIELPNEAKDLISNLKGNVDIDFATASFGQGIALTPVSTVRAMSVIANGGYLIKPHIVKSINYKIGPSKTTSVSLGKPVLKKETTEEVSRMMTYSVDNVLSNGSLRIPNYSVAAKTGTAQIAKEGGGGYYDDRFLHSFVGYFPSYNPKYIIFLYTLHPKGAQFGSETLTKPFMEIVNFLINYYEIPPDR